MIDMTEFEYGVSEIDGTEMSNGELLSTWRILHDDSIRLHMFFDNWLCINHKPDRAPSCDIEDYEQKTETLLVALKEIGACRDESEQMVCQFYEYLTGLSDPYVQDLIAKTKKRLLHCI